MQLISKPVKPAIFVNAEWNKKEQAITVSNAQCVSMQARGFIEILRNVHNMAKINKKNKIQNGIRSIRHVGFFEYFVGLYSS